MYIIPFQVVVNFRIWISQNSKTMNKNHKHKYLFAELLRAMLVLNTVYSSALTLETATLSILDIDHIANGLIPRLCYRNICCIRFLALKSRSQRTTKFWTSHHHSKVSIKMQHIFSERKCVLLATWVWPKYIQYCTAPVRVAPNDQLDYLGFQNETLIRGHYSN